MLYLHRTIFAANIIILGLMFAEVKSSQGLDYSALVNITTESLSGPSLSLVSASSLLQVQSYTFRFPPGTEVKSTIMSIVNSMNLQAASIVSALGDLRSASLKFVPRRENCPPKEVTYNENFQISGLSGTFSPEHSNLHATLSRFDGSTISGVALNLTVFRTVEIVLLNNPQEVYYEVYDPFVNDFVLAVQTL